MYWCFAIINGRLGEIYFDKVKGKPKIWGHCYVKKEEFTNKEERKWLEIDTKKYHFVYRHGKYRRVK